MYRKPERMCGPDDIVERIERPDPSARAVVGVFEGEHCGALIGDLRARRGGGAHLLRGEQPALARHAEHHESRVRRSAPVLVDHDMGVLLGDEDVAGRDWIFNASDSPSSPSARKSPSSRSEVRQRGLGLGRSVLRCSSPTDACNRPSHAPVGCGGVGRR
jgi:hypothetical protein